MKWVLVFYLADPANYRPHTGYIQLANCEAAQARYSAAFAATGSGVQAQCRARHLVNLQNPSSLVYQRYSLSASE